MIIYHLQRVTQIHGANTIFRDLTCEIRKHEKIGLIGRNGEGKTTLLQLIAGKLNPSEGRIVWSSGISVGLLEQIPEFDNQKNVNDILLDAFTDLLEIQEKMSDLEQKLSQALAASTLDEYLQKYGNLQDQFQAGGGYEIDAKVDS